MIRRRLRYMADFRAKSYAGPVPDEVAFLPMEAVGDRGEYDHKSMRPAQEVSDGYTYFERGDIVRAKVTPCFENGKGAYLHDLPVKCGFGSTELLAVTPRGDTDGRFLYYVMVSAEFVQEGASALYGAHGVKRVPEKYFRDYRAWAPPLERQRRIADYLDRETARVDELIGKRSELFSLIRERRALAVEEAIKSGVRKEVPLRYYLYEVDERSLSGDGLLLSVSLHHGVRPRQEMTDREGRADDTVGYKICKIGDLVLNRMRAFQGAIGLSSSDGLVSPDYSVLRLQPENNGNYFHYLLRTPWFIGQMTSVVRGIGTTDLGAVRTPRVNVKDLLRLGVPYLPPSDQLLRADKAAGIDARSSKYADQIEASILLLREKRQAMITEAVTGRLDISKAA